MIIQKLLFPNGKVVVVIISFDSHMSPNTYCYQFWPEGAVQDESVSEPQPISPQILETGVIRGAVVVQRDI